MESIRQLMKRLLSLLAAAVTAVGIYHLFRLRLPDGPRLSQPATTYDEALLRLKQLQALDGVRVHPRCPTQLLDHGRRTERVTVLLHGFTNCPYQFLALGHELHAAGQTVLIPRLPYHGLESASADQGALSLEDLVELVDEVVDVACGLGVSVTVCGLSLGGALSTWAAQNRPEVNRVVAFSPALGIRMVPAGWGRVLSNLLGIVPNFFLWWNSDLHEPAPGRDHQYPRFASRGVATILRLGQVVYYEAQRAKPGAHSILIVNNPTDEVVDRGFTEKVVAVWRDHGADVQTHDLPADLALPHDYIDPTQPDQQVAAAYPLILSLLVDNDGSQEPWPSD